MKSEKYKRADLHVHTNFSDGTFSPEEVILEARKREIDCIAICDHDCVEALDKASAAAETEGVELIPAIELTAEKNGNEIHMIGYYIDRKSHALLDVAARMQKVRLQRMREMVDKLKQNGVHIDADDILKLSGKGSVGRLHIAYEIYNKGYTRYVGEAFKLYIGSGKPCYVGKFNLTPAEAITTILEAGGVPVLAHPGVIGGDRFIPEYAKSGLKGIEVYHTDHTPEMKERYLKIADNMGLLVTGGSDCHGRGKGKVLLGRVTVEYSHVEKLKMAAGKL